MIEWIIGKTIVFNVSIENFKIKNKQLKYIIKIKTVDRTIDKN